MNNPGQVTAVCAIIIVVLIAVGLYLMSEGKI